MTSGEFKLLTRKAENYYFSPLIEAKEATFLHLSKIVQFLAVLTCYNFLSRKTRSTQGCSEGQSAI